MTSWFLFLLCHGLICSVFMALGMSIEKNPDSPLANALGFKSQLAKNSPASREEIQRLYGSLLKSGGAGLLVTCFICMLCVLGQTEFVISLAGGILFALEVAFYLGLHGYCQYKLKKLLASQELEKGNEKEASLPFEKKDEKREAKQAKKESKRLQKVDLAKNSKQESPSSQEVSSLQDESTSLEETQKIETISGVDSLDATRRLVFDPVPTIVNSKPSTLSRANRNQALNLPIEEAPLALEETKMMPQRELEKIYDASSSSSLTPLQPSGNDSPSNNTIQNLVLDYKIQQASPVPLKMQEEPQNGPSFHILNETKDQDEKMVKDEKVILNSDEPNFEEETLEEGVISQHFFRHPVGRVPALKEEFIADTVILHDPQEPQPIYHRATAQTKDSIEIHSEFFEQSSDHKINCPLKRSQKAKGSSNPIPPDPESAFRYRRLAASLRGEITPED